MRIGVRWMLLACLGVLESVPVGSGPLPQPDVGGSCSRSGGFCRMKVAASLGLLGRKAWAPQHQTNGRNNCPRSPGQKGR